MRETVFAAERVYTTPGEAPRSWLVVRQGRVVAVGDGDAPEADETLSFDGKVIFPGFTDAHVHLSWTGLATAGLDLSSATSREELLALARRLLEGEVVGLGFDETRWDDRRLPTLQELDQLAPSEPLVLPRMHTYMCVANTAAMRAANIDEQRGIDRDQSGYATGALRTEAAADAHRTYLESVPERKIVDALRRAAEQAVGQGLTSVHEMSMPDKRGRRDAGILSRGHGGALARRRAVRRRSSTSTAWRRWGFRRSAAISSSTAPSGLGPPRSTNHTRTGRGSAC